MDGPATVAPSKDWILPAGASRPWADDVPPVIAQVLRNRGIDSPSRLAAFMDPALHDPSLLPDMPRACQRLASALRAGETVGVFGDFDVDGVAGTAVVVQGLEDLGARVVPYIPHRVSEGHGLNADAMHSLAERGVSVLVTVDCGVGDVEEIDLAGRLGMDVIVTDHHVPPAVLPAALCIIDPKLGQGEYPFNELSGGGLAFKLMQGLYELLGRPWERHLLELAALSTVADVVPLRDENRLLVREGIEELRRTHRPGLRALCRRAGLDPVSIDAEAIAFMIAPRLNAAGRLEHASTTYRLLMTGDPEEGEGLAARLEALNRERQRMTEEADRRVRERMEDGYAASPVLVVLDPLVTPGIAGLVASRLVDEYHRPAVVMSMVDGMLRGSARSISEFDVGGALESCGDLFVRHGGHRAAAGFEMDPGKLPDLEARLGAIAEERLDGLPARPPLHIDAELPVSHLMGDTFRWLKRLEPFGAANRAPAFLTRAMEPLNVKPVGNSGRHLRMKLKDGPAVWDAIAFRQGDQAPRDSSKLDVVYNIGTEQRGGTEVLALKVLDFRTSGAV